MPVKIIQSTPSAYAYPLLIKQLLHTPLATAPDQEITYQGKLRYSYRTLRERIGRLANGLACLGIESGKTVAVMDWDSHRYLECFFAVPMMGAVLQTVNVRLSAEQILYTLNHAGADVLVINRDFFELLAPIAARLETVKHFVLIDDEPAPGDGPVRFAAEYEALLAGASAEYDFRTSTRTRRRRCSTRPERRGCRRASISATGNWCCTRSASPPASAALRRTAVCIVKTSICRSRRCSTSTRGDSPTLRLCSG